MNPLRLDIQPGTEKHLPFAKELLRQLKWNLKQRGLLNGDHRTKVADTDIYVQAVAGVDLIRIRGGDTGFLIFLYNTNDQVIVFVIQTDKSGLALTPTQRDINIQRKYDSRNAVVLYNPVKSEHIVDMSGAGAGVIKRYGVQFREGRANYRYGTGYVFRPSNINESSVYVLDEDLQDDGLFPEPWCTGRKNFMLDEQRRMVSYAHTIFKETGEFEPSRYRYYFKASGGFQPGNLFGQDSSTQILIPVATIGREQALYILETIGSDDSHINTIYNFKMKWLYTQHWHRWCWDDRAGDYWATYMQTCTQAIPGSINESNTTRTMQIIFGDIPIEQTEYNYSVNQRSVSLILNPNDPSMNIWTCSVEELTSGGLVCDGYGEAGDYDDQGLQEYYTDGAPFYAELLDPMTQEVSGNPTVSESITTETGQVINNIIDYDNMITNGSSINNDTFICFYSTTSFNNSKTLQMSSYQTAGFYTGYTGLEKTPEGRIALTGDVAGSGTVGYGVSFIGSGISFIPMLDKRTRSERTSYIMSYRTKHGSIKRVTLASFLYEETNNYHVTAFHSTGREGYVPYIYSTGTIDFTRTINSSTSGTRISKVSCQVHKNYIAYTYVLEIYNETSKEWEFSKRSLGIIRISDGFRQEFDIDDALLSEEPYSSFDYQSLSAVGIQE